MRDIENKLTNVTNSTYDQLNNAAVKFEVEPAQVIVMMSRQNLPIIIFTSKSFADNFPRMLLS